MWPKISISTDNSLAWFNNSSLDFVYPWSISTLILPIVLWTKGDSIGCFITIWSTSASQLPLTIVILSKLFIFSITAFGLYPSGRSFLGPWYNTSPIWSNISQSDNTSNAFSK